ncbi:MAG: hypothetical protein SFU25_03940 [Candidatus Caenarcaniphilales bacterium]|nr:hypothetical protein [Candidatus Caenarcaniphilales bacterium]
MSNPTTNASIPQFNPNQFGLLGLPNSGFFNGLGAYPLGGFGATTSSTDGSFDSLFSSLNSSGTFGPGLYNNLGPAGSNPQAIATATEGAHAFTSSLLNRVSPLDLPPEALYSSSVFGRQSSGMSFLDTLGTMTTSLAGIIDFGQDSRTRQLLISVSPAIGALNGVFGIFQGLRAANNTPTVRTMSTPEAIEDYKSDDDSFSLY